jgi:hypothetical protein
MQGVLNCGALGLLWYGFFSCFLLFSCEIELFPMKFLHDSCEIPVFQRRPYMAVCGYNFLQLYLLFIITCRGGKKVYEPPRFMTVNTAISQLLEVEEAHGESGRLSELVFFQKCSSPNIS